MCTFFRLLSVLVYYDFLLFCTCVLVYLCTSKKGGQVNFNCCCYHIRQLFHHTKRNALLRSQSQCKKAAKAKAKAEYMRTRTATWIESWSLEVGHLPLVGRKRNKAILSRKHAHLQPVSKQHELRQPYRQGKRGARGSVGGHRIARPFN